MMDAMEVAAALRRAADNAGCETYAVMPGSYSCPDCPCSECNERSRAWFLDAADAIERSALPEGLEWPRYESGEPVMFDDCVENRYGICTVNSVRFYKGGGVTVYGEDDGAQFVVVTEPVMHEPIRKARPNVLAADGEPLEVGQTVWEVDGTGHPFKVVSIRLSTVRAMEPTVVTCDVGDGTSEHILPSQLTHQRPVLDADGVPIKVGDTVWDTETGCGRTVRAVNDNETVEFDGYENRGWFGKFLTHTKPEPPDTWERIEEDAKVMANPTMEERVGLVRRCKALAERGER